MAAPITQSAGQATTVQVSATNTTASAATLAGWIDLNGNGTFDPAERVTVTVPASSGTATYPLTFPVSSTNSDTYARFRLFPGSVASPLPTGAATAGEVEDYPVTGNVPVVTCATDPALFNTAYNGVRAARPPWVSLDRNWQVAVGNAPARPVRGLHPGLGRVTRNPAWYAGHASATRPGSPTTPTPRTPATSTSTSATRFRIDPEVSLTGFAAAHGVLRRQLGAGRVGQRRRRRTPSRPGCRRATGDAYTYAGLRPGQQGRHLAQPRLPARRQHHRGAGGQRCPGRRVHGADQRQGAVHRPGRRAGQLRHHRRDRRQPRPARLRRHRTHVVPHDRVADRRRGRRRPGRRSERRRHRGCRRRGRCRGDHRHQGLGAQHRREGHQHDGVVRRRWRAGSTSTSRARSTPTSGPSPPWRRRPSTGR